MKLFKVQKNKGFTLVETLIAISIFSASIIALTGVLSKSISSVTYAQKANTAAFLAQEGIEYMRNMRDTYVLYSADAATGWSNFQTKLSGASCASGCFFNPDNLFSLGSSLPITQMTMTACSGGSCSNGAMLYDSSSGKYNYTSGTSSGFVRKITYTTISANEIKVSSTVSWSQPSGSYSTTFSENLFNWVE